MGFITNNRPVLRNFARRMAYRLRNDNLYRLCSFYINAVDNNYDCDLSTNGEGTFARAMLPGCAVAFDVGAAKGDWTDIALRADPRLVVHCFEPASRRFAVLNRRGFGPRAVMNKLGLGDRSESRSIYYGTSGGSNSLFPQRDEPYATDDVEMIHLSTIDRYCQERRIERVDFVKMDIEGYELAAIRGAESMLRSRRIGVIQFEYGQVYLDAGTSLKHVMEYVRSISDQYEFYKLYPDRPHHVPEYDTKLENFKTQNWAIIRRDLTARPHDQATRGNLAQDIR